MLNDNMVIVKIGGGLEINKEAVCDDVALMTATGRPFILVHGGSRLTNEIATALNRPPQFVTSPSGYSSRLTDRPALEIFEMVYCGRINKEFVELLQQRGVNAIGLSGLDGRVWSGPRKKAIRVVENGRERIIRDTYTGRVTAVNTALLRSLLDAGYVPVISPPAISDNSEAINVDGDRAAAATAVAMQADELLILSDVPGLLADFPHESSLIRQLRQEELDRVRRDFARGRMRIKLLAATEALDGGVSRVVLGDARGSAPITAAMAGEGTVITVTGE